MPAVMTPVSKAPGSDLTTNGPGGHNALTPPPPPRPRRLGQPLAAAGRSGAQRRPGMYAIGAGATHHSVRVITRLARGEEGGGPGATPCALYTSEPVECMGNALSPARQTAHRPVPGRGRAASFTSLSSMMRWGRCGGGLGPYTTARGGRGKRISCVAGPQSWPKWSWLRQLWESPCCCSR